MVLVRLTRQLLAVPLLLAAMVAAFLSPRLGARLQELAWLVGGDPAAGLTALIKLLPIEGPHAVRTHAGAMLAKRPAPVIAAYAGLLALEAGDGVEARGMLDLAKGLGGDPQCLTELLEFRLVSARSADHRGTWDLVRKWSTRRDLSPLMSKLVLTTLLWMDLAEHQFDQARRRAERCLAIEDDPQIETILETVHHHQGRTAQAAQCTARLAAVPQAHVLFWRSLASHAVGMTARAAEALAELRDHDEGLADNAASQILRTGSGG